MRAFAIFSLFLTTCAHVPLDLDGIRTRELRVGSMIFDALVAGPEDGELVLLLHGFPETSVSWRAQLHALGDAGYFVVAPNQRGISARARPVEVEAYKYGLLVDDVFAFADALGRESFHLVGHDWGAVVAWGVAARAPERVQSLAVFSIPHPDAFAAALHDKSSCQYEASSYFDTFTEDGIEDRLLGFGAFAMRNLIYRGLQPAAVDAYLEVLAEPGALTAALNWYRANIADRTLLPPPVGKVEVATLFVWSDDDNAVCKEPALATAAEVNGPYRFEILEGVDHWIPERAPERVNALLLTHLQSVRSAI